MNDDTNRALIEPLEDSLGENSGRVVFHQRKKILWVKPKAVAWGMISFERALEHLFEVRYAWACFSNEKHLIDQYLNAAIGQLHGVDCVIYDGVGFVPGLRNELRKLDIPVVSYEVDVDNSEYAFDDDANLVIDRIFQSIYLVRARRTARSLPQEGDPARCSMCDALFSGIYDDLASQNRYHLNPGEHWPMKKVFLSYSRVDADLVRRVALDMRGKYDVWVDFLSLKPGQRWENEIEKNIRAGDKLVLFLSTLALSKRGYFQSEIKKAEKVKDMFPEGSIFLIPCRIDDCTPPRFVNEFHFLDLFQDDYKAFVYRLCESLDQS